MAEALTTLQMCGFDPIPYGATVTHPEGPIAADPQSNILQVLQHQGFMQTIILQQFQQVIEQGKQIHTLKETITQIIGEQQRQANYIKSLEAMLFRTKSTGGPEAPVRKATPESPIAPDVPLKHPEPVSAGAHNSGNLISPAVKMEAQCDVASYETGCPAARSSHAEGRGSEA